jgi:hypothetical protein
MKTQKKTPLDAIIPENLQAAVNKLVRYYYEGWRAGYLEGFTKMGAAIIRPIGAIGGQKPQTIKVEQANVKTVEECIHESRQIYGDCACDKAEPESEPEKPKRKKREKVKAMREVLVKEFVDDNPPIECLVKKTKRGCRL